MRQDGVSRKDGRSIPRGVRSQPRGRPPLHRPHRVGPQAPRPDGALRRIISGPHAAGGSGHRDPSLVPGRCLRIFHVGLLGHVQIEGGVIRRPTSDLKDVRSGVEAGVRDMSRAPSTTGPARWCRPEPRDALNRA